MSGGVEGMDVRGGIGIVLMMSSGCFIVLGYLYIDAWIRRWVSCTEATFLGHGGCTRSCIVYVVLCWLFG